MDLVYSPKGIHPQGRVRALVRNASDITELRDLLQRFQAKNDTFGDFDSSSRHWFIDIYEEKGRRTLEVYYSSLKSPLNASVVSTGDDEIDRQLLPMLKKIRESARISRRADSSKRNQA